MDGKGVHHRGDVDDDVGEETIPPPHLNGEREGNPPLYGGEGRGIDKGWGDLHSVGSFLACSAKGSPGPASTLLTAVHQLVFVCCCPPMLLPPRFQVKGLEFNSFSPNLLASGGLDSDLCIWDLAKPSAPSMYPALRVSQPH